jgi:predicted amidohydrolase
VRPLRVALAQIAPRLGLVDDNLRRHHELLREARAGGAELCVFPELGLTGYLLQDLNAEVAMRADDPRLAKLAAETDGLSAVVGFVEESDDHRLFISAALLEDGAIRHVHRKVFLPTYGLFDERRFFAAGSVIRAARSRLGVPVGLAICEDFWHLSVPELLALDGAQVLINISSSPGRDVAAVNEVGLGTASSWWTLMRAYAQLTTAFVIYVNRVGVDESITFWGGSEIVGPAGNEIFRAPLHDEGLYFSDVDLDDVRRERISLPLLRDERPEVILRQLERIVRARSGADADAVDPPDSPDSTGLPGGTGGPGQAAAPDGRTAGRVDVAKERR